MHPCSCNHVNGRTIMKNDEDICTCIYLINYGSIELQIGKKMKEKNISCYQMSKLTGLRYEVVKRYYNNSIYRIDLDVLSRMLYILECDISEIMIYNSQNMDNAEAVAGKKKM
jgi:putative transcriptional regulator